MCKLFDHSICDLHKLLPGAVLDNPTAPSLLQLIIPCGPAAAWVAQPDLVLNWSANYTDLSGPSLILHDQPPSPHTPPPLSRLLGILLRFSFLSYSCRSQTTIFRPAPPTWHGQSVLRSACTPHLTPCLPLRGSPAGLTPQHCPKGPVAAPGAAPQGAIARSLKGGKKAPNTACQRPLPGCLLAAADSPPKAAL